MAYVIQLVVAAGVLWAAYASGIFEEETLRQDAWWVVLAYAGLAAYGCAAIAMHIQNRRAGIKSQYRPFLPPRIRLALGLDRRLKGHDNASKLGRSKLNVRPAPLDKLLK